MLIIFISLGGIPPLLGFLGKIIILKILLNNFIRITIIFAIIVSSLLLLYFYLSRIYFYLTNIPSLKINFKLRLNEIYCECGFANNCTPLTSPTDFDCSPYGGASTTK